MRKIFYLFILFFLLFAIFFNFETNKNFVVNKDFDGFLLRNKSLFDSCMSDNDNLTYYKLLYKRSIKVINFLNSNGYIKNFYRKELLKLLNSGQIYLLKNKIEFIDISSLSPESISNKFFLKALVNDMSFDSKNAEKYYKLAIENNKFVYDYYFYLARFYRRNCRYNDSIKILKDISLFLDGEKRYKNILYSDLGDMYFDLGKYYDSLLNYNSALINLEVSGNDVDKYHVLVKIGDIMAINGNSFESNEYYKYALSLNNRKIKKTQNIELLIKISSNYNSYGNYYNALKFAKIAEKKALSLKNDFLFAKAKYEQCLNYDFLNEKEKAESSCFTAKKSLDNKIDLYSYIQLADMLANSPYLKNYLESIEYYEKALLLINKNLFLKNSISNKVSLIKLKKANN